MKFWIIADGAKQGKVDAEDADDAMEVWLEQNGFESIDEACDEFLIDYNDFEVIPA